MSKNFQFLIHRQAYQFNFKIGFTVLCLFFFILFCILGVWQLHRYSFKKNLIATYNQHSMSFSGNYKNLTIIMQNKFYNEQDGFEIFTPLKIENQNKLILVDRGWIKKTGNQLPVVTPIKKQQHIVGHIKELNEYQFILGKNILEQRSDYLVIQKIDVAELQRATGQEYYPFFLQLDASQPNGYVRDWIISAVMPERHMGYAIQWFVMAAVLLIAYFCFCCEKIKSKTLMR